MAAKPIDKSKMSWHSWLLFMATEVTLCLTPGPAVLFVVSQALQYGSGVGDGGGVENGNRERGTGNRAVGNTSSRGAK